MLASEVFDYLLESSELDDETRRMLWRDRNFEDVLAALQRSTNDEGKKRYNDLVSALVGMFNGMGQAFMRHEFEFRNPPDTRYSLQSFLARFDAIFTLNQDTLLEQKYIASSGRPNGGAPIFPASSTSVTLSLLGPYTIGSR